MSPVPEAKAQRPKGRATGIIVAIVSLIVVALVSGYLYALGPATRNGLTPGGIVLIERGLGAADIAHLLARQGYIRCPTVFGIHLILTGQTDRLQSGYYEISSDMSMPQIIGMLAEGRHAVAYLTIPEGLTIVQISKLVETTLLTKDEEFQAAATVEAVKNRLGVQLPPTATSAEGYLFPETYRFELGTNPHTIVNRMVEEFRQRFLKPLLLATPPDERWGRVHEVVTLASLVEEEAKVDEERALIAGVLLNRLKKGMKLQCDATVQYALPERKARLTYEDLKIPSPYNTYLHQGLPPGPISNPGLPSLRAALQPAETQYLYYVARGDGTHIFSRTYQEHLAAIKKIRSAGPRGL